MSLDLTDIQGNILRGYAMPCARYVFLRLGDRDGGRAFLGAVADRVTNAEIWDDGKPQSTLNVALSRSALRILELPQETIASFPVEFLDGMAARWDVLGDDGASHPDNWEPMWRERIDLWGSINALSPEARELGFAALAALAEEHGVTIVSAQDAAALTIDGQRVRSEHFGFADGFGQPDFVGGEAKNVPGDGKIGPKGRGWEEIATGEFILGHRSEADELSGTLDPALLAKNGSFLVYRKLEQDVRAFRSYVREWGARYPGGPEELMAKFVGRWRDGTPLMLSPDGPDPAISGDPNRINDFTYADDPQGLRCPIGAHIRRVNPRDSQGFNGRMATRRRIIRRGLPYGEAVPEGAEPDASERGIVFMAIAASIAHQFEFVQQQWVNYGNDFKLGEERDPVIGSNNGGGFFAIPGGAGKGQPPFFCSDLPSFVTVRGGDYFFLPSLSALRLIAAGAIDPR